MIEAADKRPSLGRGRRQHGRPSKNGLARRDCKIILGFVHRAAAVGADAGALQVIADAIPQPAFQVRTSVEAKDSSLYLASK
jgi:hypothetical protein